MCKILLSTFAFIEDVDFRVLHSKDKEIGCQLTRQTNSKHTELFWSTVAIIYSKICDLLSYKFHIISYTFMDEYLIS